MIDETQNRCVVTVNRGINVDDIMAEITGQGSSQANSL